MRYFVQLIMAICLTACATTDVEPLVETPNLNLTQVTPVLKEVELQFDIDSKYKLADRAYEQENYAISSDIYQEILVYDQTEIAAQIGLGNAQLALGNYVSAQKLFTILKSKPVSDEYEQAAKLGLILATVLAGDATTPLSRLHDGIEINPSDARLWNAKGQIHDQNEDWIAALDAYLMAIKLSGARAGTINNMGMSLLKQGRYEEALAKFEHALELMPGHRLYDNNYRLTLILQEDMGSALFGVTDEQGANIVNDAGYIMMQRGQLGSAKYLFETAIRLSPKFHVQANANLSRVKELG